MKYFLATVYLICNHLIYLAAWQQYADQISIPVKKSEPFIFEMDIQRKLSMNYLDEVGHAHLVDYSPNDQSWLVRSMDQLMACDLNAPLNDAAQLATVVQMDGLHRRFIAINGESPARPMVVPFGAEVIMRVQNNLMSEAISIHLHGMDKKNLWYTDGVAFVQQCPIPPSSTYSYRFIADTPGTFWFHGHLGADRGAGLLGAFIVARNDEHVPDSKGNGVLPSRQYVAFLQNQLVPSVEALAYNQKVKAMKWMYGYDSGKCFAPSRTYDGASVSGSMPISAILINDKGWHNQTEVMNKPDTLPLETYRINQGEKVLIRFVNGGTSQMLMIAVEDHQMTVVAADGQLVKPAVVDMLILSSGERYDVLIEGKENPERKHYHIIVETLEHYEWNWNKRLPFYGLAKLEYNQFASNMRVAPDFFHQKACSHEQPCVVLNCPFQQFPPEYPYDCKNSADLRSLTSITDISILSDQGFTAGYQEHFININSHPNGWEFELPKGVPYFYHGRENEITNACDESKCPSHNCKCFFHLNITLGNIVQLTIYNMGKGNGGSGAGNGYAHPVHIHGTHFYLMKVGYPNYNKTTGFEDRPNDDLPCSLNSTDTKCNNLQWSNKAWLNGRVGDMNTVDPSFRDTVLLPAGGYIVIRFRADNPGWFYGHCHIMMHQMGGTAFALRIGEHSQMPQPPDNFPHSCGIYEQPSISQSLPSSAQPMTMNLHHNSSYVYRILLIAVFMLICNSQKTP